MSATPARVALLLNDGVVLSKVDATIKTAHPNAEDQDGEYEMFFDNSADGQVLIDERWNWKSTAGRAREQIELDTSFGLGTTVAVTPAVPTFTVTDAIRGINLVPCKTRGYSIDYNTERYAIELAA